MSNCQQCNSPLAPDALFCGKCGAKRLEASLIQTKHEPFGSQTNPESILNGHAQNGPGPFAILLFLFGGVLIAFAGYSAFVDSPSTTENAQTSYKSKENQTAKLSRKSEGATVTDPSGSFSGHSDVDNPDDYPYHSIKQDCSSHEKLSDVMKGAAKEVHDEMTKTPRVTWSEEKEYGDSSIAQLRSAEPGIKDRGPVVAYMKKVVEPMLPFLNRKEVQYSFYFWENSADENAFALPGGHIVVTKPLYERWLENEAQFAAVLGHEMAHVDKRHVTAIIEWAKKLGLPRNQVVQKIIHQVQRPYSTNLEQESDSEGANYMHKAGYSVFQAVRVWQARADERQDSERPDPKPSKSPAGIFGEILEQGMEEMENLILSHPKAGKRACLLKAKAFELYQNQYSSNPYVGRRNLRERIAMIEKKY